MREMKDSGIEWIKSIPKAWEVTRGKNILELKKRSADKYGPDDVITCFRDGEVTLRRNRREDGFTFSDKEIGYQGIKKGDLVIHGMDGFAGAIGISDSDGKASPVLVVCDSEQNKSYLMYYLRMLAQQDVFLALATGIRERSCDLRWNKIAELLFPLPSIVEQKRIADYLDSKLQAIDTIISKQTVLIEKLKEYKISFITEAVTNGLHRDAIVKNSGIEWIGEIPEDWSIGKTLYALSMPITDGPHETPQLFDEGIPFVSAEAVSCGNGSIDFNHVRGYISEDYYRECCKKYVPHINDIYMIKSGATTGKVAIVETDIKFTIWSPLAVFRCDESRMFYRYLFYFLQSDAYQKQVQDGWTYGTQQNIGMRTLEKLFVCFPPIEEQREIARFLDEKIIQVDTFVDKVEQNISKLKDYKKSILYEVVTGKKEV